MSKDLSGKYYQNNKERLLKKLVKDIKVFLKKKKKKSDNMVMNNTKIYQKMKNKSLLIKMDKRIIEFDDNEIKKYKFHQDKSSILITM